MDKRPLSFKCAARSCYEPAYGSHAVCRSHLVLDVILYGGVMLALFAGAIAWLLNGISHMSLLFP